jgi:hypothetical protein
MKAQQFNELIAKRIFDEFEDKGFIQKSVHFYIHEPPNVFVFFKKTSRGFFEGFHLACTHDFMENTKTDKGKFKLPTLLADYPVSIPLKMLVEQYSKHNSIFNFDFDINYLTRVVLKTRNYSFSESIEFLAYDDMLKDDIRATDYIENSIKILKKEGFRFFNEFSPKVSLFALSRYKRLNAWAIENFKKEIVNYMVSNNIELPKFRNNWWNRILK